MGSQPSYPGMDPIHVQLLPTLYTRSSDVIDVIDIIGRHVGGITYFI